MGPVSKLSGGLIQWFKSYLTADDTVHLKQKWKKKHNRSDKSPNLGMVKPALD